MKNLLLSCVFLCLPVLAAAQPAPAAPPAGGPLVLEPVHNRFVIAPDIRVTEFNDEVEALAGGYAGVLLADSVLVGGAVYWMPDGSNGSDLVYGGLLAGWQTPAERRVQFGARGLVGLGQAELGSDIAWPFDRRFSGMARDFVSGMRQLARFGAQGMNLDRLNLGGEFQRMHAEVEQGFFVFEPQLTLHVRLASRVGLGVSGGYRLVAASDGLSERLQGASGGVSLQFALR